MSDYDKLKELLAEFGVGFIETKELGRLEKRIRCEPFSPKIDGLSGLFTDFEFTEDGAFIRMGAWYYPTH
jgi:hypothetical protein